MEIKVEKNRNAVNFSTLKQGAVFKYETEFYMKTQSENSTKSNAVCLEDGFWAQFYDNDEVYRLTEAYLAIKE